MRGIGSQLMHSNVLSGQRVQLAILGEQARQRLNSQEMMTMNYYLSEYQHGRLAVDALVSHLLRLLNSRSKVYSIQLRNFTSLLNYNSKCLFEGRPTLFIMRRTI